MIGLYDKSKKKEFRVTWRAILSKEGAYGCQAA